MIDEIEYHASQSTWMIYWTRGFMKTEQIQKPLNLVQGPFNVPTGGGNGIRTHDEVAPITVFKTVAFVHSAIPPLSDGRRRGRHRLARIL